MRNALLALVIVVSPSVSLSQDKDIKSPLEKLEAKLDGQKKPTKKTGAKTDNKKQTGQGAKKKGLPAPPQNQEKLPPPPKTQATGYLGIDGIDAGQGVQIASVKAASPASVAGLRVADRIIAVGNKAVRNVDGLANVLAKTKPGDQISVTVQRGRARVLMQITLARKPPVGEAVPPIVAKPENVAPPVTSRSGAVTGTPLLGIRAIPIAPTARIRLGLPVRQGALITHIYPNTPASKHRLPVGSVIIAMDGKRITSPDDVIAFMKTKRIGSTSEITFYDRGILTKTKVLLNQASDAPRANAAPPVVNNRVQRPLLNQLESLIDGRRGPDLEKRQLKERIAALEEEVRLLSKRLAELEKKVKAKTKQP